MVKSRQAKIKAKPLPNRFSIKVADDGIASIRKIAEESRSADLNTSGSGDNHGPHSSSSRGVANNSNNNNFGARGSVPYHKRPIFPHLTRLQHGVLRYRNVAESPTSVAGLTSTEKDRRFVFVPAGYSIESDQSMREILGALQLNNLPPLVIVTAATDGAVEETMDEEERPQFPKLAPPTNLDHLSEDEERELLKEKTEDILKKTVELCGETGAWLLPHRPRMANGAAAIICSAIHDDNPQAPSRQAVILGMIGLDQQDQQAGFTTKISNHMVPVGSEVAVIADVPYDPAVRDHTPCPELTHLLLFQRRQEMRAFRERLLATTPDVFLCFGSTTAYAKKVLLSALVQKSPVALVTHTSPEIDHMSWMLRHADRELQKIQVGESDPPARGMAALAVSGESTSYATQPLPPLPDLEAADPELASFLPVWPAGHDDERIVLADPRRVGGIRFQHLLLRAVNAAFYIKEARTVAIQESTRVLKSMHNSAENEQKMTERFHLCMVIASLVAVVAAVLYAKIYGEDPPPSLENRNPYQIGLFLLTLGLPLLIVYLKKRYDDNSQRWSSIQKESANLESAIASFRTRPRAYGQSTSSSQEPLDAFVSDVIGIYSRAFGSDEGIVIQEEEAETTISDEHPESSPAGECDVEAPPPSESSPLLASTSSNPNIPVPSRFEDLAIRDSTGKWKKTSATISSKNSEDSDPNESIDGDKTQQYLDVMNSSQKQALVKNDNPSSEDEPSLDNRIDVIWTIEDYIDARIHVVKAQKESELEVLEQRNKIMELIIKVILASTALMALLSKQWAIPMVLGVSTSFLSSQDFRKYRTRVNQGTSMIHQLEELLSWWASLDIEDKILASNEDRLVQVAESIIAADVAFTY